MIKIEFYNNGLLIQGHADAAEYSKDIYCAAVSAISQGAINWFNVDDINYLIEDGYLKLVILNQTKKNIEYLSLLKTQLLALKSTQTNKYIKFKDNKKDL